MKHSAEDRAAAFLPDYAVPPGDTLADMLAERDLTQTALAHRLGVSLKHVNQVIKGAASISAELALGLEAVLGVSADFWLKRESLYRADLARNARRADLAAAADWARQFPIADLRSWGLLAADAKGGELVEELLNFFGVASPRQLEEPSAAFRKSLKFASDPFALRSWLRWGEIQANEIRCRPFDDGRFKEALQAARGISRLDVQDWESKLRELCTDAGVAVVIAPTFAKVRAHGAAWWSSPTKAIIQLSLRYKWEDIFWFSFFHEAGHILLHRKKQMFIEPKYRSDLRSADSDERRWEEEADRFAANTLIPRGYESELQGIDPADRDSVFAIAAKVGVSPAIVVGRLQHDTRHFDRGNDMRRRLQFER